MAIAQHDQERLVAAALAARQRAYAPYSGFHVGAAVLCASNTIHVGCNVENVSFGLTCCAERTAIFTAIAQGDSRFLAVAVASDGGVSPCGACRQVLAEFCPNVPIILVDAQVPTKVQSTDLDALLPCRFGPETTPQLRHPS